MKPLRRKTPRLPYRDYSGPGRYFVTICVERKICVLGRVVHRRERLNGAGSLVRREWEDLAKRFPHVTVEEFVIMPNHLHGLLWFREEPAGKRASLGQVVGAFKSLTTRAYNKGVQNAGWRPLDGRLWQRGYFERVMRDDEDHMHAVWYMARNPTHWLTDPLHPDYEPPDPPDPPLG